jgi:hypothetical protein
MTLKIEPGVPQFHLFTFNERWDWLTSQFWEPQFQRQWVGWFQSAIPVIFGAENRSEGSVTVTTG